MGLVFGVFAALEFDEGKLAGWKRGREGSFRLLEPVLCCLPGLRRGAWEGMARVSVPALADMVVAVGDIMVVRDRVDIIVVSGKKVGLPFPEGDRSDFAEW